MSYLFDIDRTGFPMMYIARAGAYVQLLPLTKVQVERFLAEPFEEFGNEWYESLLVLNARCSYNNVTARNREQAFITGMTPHEAERIAQWFGSGFDLPTRDQWCMIYRTMHSLKISDLSVERSHLCKPARVLLERLEETLSSGSATLSSLLLFDGGLVEWVRDRAEPSVAEQHWVGMGMPRSSFFNLVFNPDRDRVEPLNVVQRAYYFGTRLVRNSRDGRPIGGYAVKALS